MDRSINQIENNLRIHSVRGWRQRASLNRREWKNVLEAARAQTWLLEPLIIVNIAILEFFLGSIMLYLYLILVVM
jgi:hypothetical protein